MTAQVVTAQAHATRFSGQVGVLTGRSRVETAGRLGDELEMFGFSPADTFAAFEIFDRLSCRPSLFLPADNDRVEALRPLLAKNLPEPALEAELLRIVPPGPLRSRIESPTLPAPVAGQRALFRYVKFADFASAKPPEFLVKGALVAGTVHAFYGATKAGKTFATLDLALRVSAGLPWFDMPTEKAAVLWVAAEDSGGVMLRARAWAKHHGIVPAGFVVMEGSRFDLRQATTVDHIEQYAARVLAETGCAKILIVIDTLSKAAPGADEISGKDTGEVMAAFDRIRYNLPATICVIHHSGKNEEAGLRGHSSLGQGIDSFARVVATGAGSKIVFEKVKNAKLPMPIGFELRVVVVEMGADGDPLDSCVVLPRDMRPVEIAPLPLAEDAKKCLSSLVSGVRDEGVDLPEALTGFEGTRGVPTVTWRAAYKAQHCDGMKAGTFRKAWQRTSKYLVDGGHVMTCTVNDTEYVYVVDTS